MLQFGQIVCATVVDPAGRNAKNRPLIIIDHDEIAGELSYWCVAVSSRTPTVTEDAVLLPWNKDPHLCRTQLTRKCFAVTNWIVSVRECDIDRTLGVVPPDRLAAIMERLPTDDSSG